MLATIGRRRVEIFTLAVGIFLAWLLWTARGALPAFVIGLALAFVLDPGVTLLQRRGLPRWAGVLAMYALAAIFGWLVIRFGVAPIAAQLNEFLTRLPELGRAAQDVQAAINAWYAGLPLPPPLRDAIDASLQSGEQALGDLVNSIAAPFFGAVLRTATFILGLLIIPIWLFFVLKDRERLPEVVAAALPAAWRDDARNVLALLAGVGGRWVRGQLLLGAAIFAATAVGLTALTLLGFGEFARFTLVLALIAGILEWLPIIGPVLAAVPAILIALTISPAAVIAVIVLYVVIQQVENNLLVPKVMGDAIELHPAVMILALVVGGGLFGFWGAVLAAPVVAAGRDLYRYTFMRLSGDTPALAVARAGGPVVVELATPDDPTGGTPSARGAGGRGSRSGRTERTASKRAESATES